MQSPVAIVIKLNEQLSSVNKDEWTGKARVGKLQRESTLESLALSLPVRDTKL